MAMRSAVMLGTSSSSFSGRSVAFKSSSATSAAPRAVVVSVEAAVRRCQLTGGYCSPTSLDVCKQLALEWLARADLEGLWVWVKLMKQEH